MPPPRRPCCGCARSLWVDGQYEGDRAVALRRVAKAAGCEFQRDAALGAPADHIGCLLLLWCACVDSKPDLAELIAHEHLDWVDRALRATAAQDGFYAQVARATCELVATLRGSAE